MITGTGAIELGVLRIGEKPELRNAGYKIIRFWENEVKDIDYVKDKIENFIKSINNSLQMVS